MIISLGISVRVSDLGATGGIGRHLRCEVLYVDIVSGFRVMGHTLALAISDKIVGSVLDLGRGATLGLKAIIAHVKHLSCEGLSHDGLTRLASDLSQDTLSVGATVTDRVRGVRLMVWDLGVEAV